MRDYASGYTLHHRVRGLTDRRRAVIGSLRGVLVPQITELPSYRAYTQNSSPVQSSLHTTLLASNESQPESQALGT